MSHSPGTLFYLMGASGSGKDSILKQFRDTDNNEAIKPVVIAHRYITRQTDETENSVSLSPMEFDLRKQHHLFAFDWQAHGLSYGVGIEINHWLAQGLSVLVNGSRAHLDKMKTLYGNQLHSILVSVNDSVLAERLNARERESDEFIAHRLQRHQTLKNSVVADNIITNDHSLDQAVQQLAQLIQLNSFIEIQAPKNSSPDIKERS